MAYTTISYGSSGNDVRKLQEALNKKGYGLTVDGEFGEKTRNAVRDYQRKNNLTVDGIVGENTWSSLIKKQSKNTSKNNNSNKSRKNTETAMTSPRPTYQKGEDVINAENQLNRWEKNAPNEYQSQYDERIEAYLDQILNREQFSYDLESDPVYRQYRQLYIRNGERAMADTIGEASAYTGGYGSSYAQTAGQQAYDNYLEGLNDVALELYDMAYKAYMDEGQKLVEDLEILRELDGDDYERYLDELDKYYADGEYLLKKLSEMSDKDYEQFLQAVSEWESDRDYQYQKQQDALEHQEFLDELEFKRQEALRQQANEDREYQLAREKLNQSKSKSSSKSSSSRSSKSTSKDKDESEKKTNEYTVYPKTYGQFVALTGYAGIMSEAMFKSSSPMKEKYGTYQKYLEVMYDKYAK